MKDKTTECNHNFKTIRGEQRKYVYQRVCFDCGEILDSQPNNIFTVLEDAYNSIFDCLCEEEKIVGHDFSDILVEVRYENGVTIRHSYKDNQKRLRQKEEEFITIK